MHCQKSVIIFFENTVPLNMRLRMQPRFVTIDKMAGIFTKRIWQPYIRSTWNWAKSCMWLASRGLARPGINEPSHSVERMEAFCDTNPVQYLHCVIQSDPNSVVLLKCLIQSGLNPKIPLIEHLTGVINTVWISVSDPVELFFEMQSAAVPVLNCRIQLDRDPETGSCSTLPSHPCWDLVGVPLSQGFLTFFLQFPNF